ncbi:uncharacterized protein LOC121425884 [Lytechinus variegatus]|uniref:uncharacterized protein LOC121425884 n=1 Tax=Lytechinus variegatus TaxID=7654 RepID=UPI001BB1D89F|nr:uncharacterized protein LOC121425884 [Lytechinus variegatus]
MASKTTSAIPSATTSSDCEGNIIQSKSSFAEVLNLQTTSTLTASSCNEKTTSFATMQPTTPVGNTDNAFPKILQSQAVVNAKRSCPQNEQTPEHATSLTTPTTPDGQAATPTTTNSQTGTCSEQKCASGSVSGSEPYSSTISTSATATTTLPSNRIRPASSPHPNVSQPFHPGKLSRNQLPLDMKIEAIRLREEEGLSARSIMEIMNMHGFKCGKTQVQNILKRKDEWIDQYAQNVPLSRKRKLRKTGNEEINHKVYEWFEGAIDRMIPVNGPMLQQKAVEIARELGIAEFKGSNGWLESFRRRHSISFGKAKGLEGDSPASALMIPKKSSLLEKGSLGSNGETLSKELPQMIVGEYMKKDTCTSESSLQAGAIDGNDSPKLLAMLLKKKGNDWCKIKQDDTAGPEKGQNEKNEEEKKDNEDKKDKEEKETSSNLKFKSIHHVAEALREMKIFFATNNYSHLLDSCLDLEEQVTLESIARKEAEEKATVLDHLHPLDTRPSSNMDPT